MEIIRYCKCCEKPSPRSKANLCSCDKYINEKGFWLPNNKKDLLCQFMTIFNLTRVPTESLQKSQIAILPMGSFRETADISIPVLSRLCTRIMKRLFIFIPCILNINYYYLLDQTYFHTHLGCCKCDIDLITNYISNPIPGFRFGKNSLRYEKQMLLLQLNYIMCLLHANQHFGIEFTIVPVFVPCIESKLIDVFANYFKEFMLDPTNLFLFLIPLIEKEPGLPSPFHARLTEALTKKSYEDLEQVYAERTLVEEPMKTLKILVKMVEQFEAEERHKLIKLDVDEHKLFLDKATFKHVRFESQIAKYTIRNKEPIFGGAYRIVKELFQERNWKSAQEWKDSLVTEDPGKSSKGKGSGKDSPKGSKKDSPKSSKKESPKGSGKGSKKDAAAQEPVVQKLPIIDVGVGPD